MVLLLLLLISYDLTKDVGNVFYQSFTLLNSIYPYTYCILYLYVVLFCMFYDL